MAFRAAPLASVFAVTAVLAVATVASANGQTGPAPIVHPEIWPRPHWPYQPDPALEARIAALLAMMTLEEKVGQVVQADIASVTPDDVRRYHLGSILNGGNSAPGGDEFAPAEKWLALADAFYDASVDKTGGRAAIPIIWGTDAVHGHSNIVGATIFPHNIGLGAARDPDLLERIAAATAVELRTTGMEWTFAPTVTVPQDVRWGRTYEGYSEDPKLVTSYVGRFIKGLQGAPGKAPILGGPHVLASTKHFLADGGTFEGRDQGDARISEEALRDIHGAPYVAAIDAGVQTVMASFSSWNGEKLTGHKGLLTDVLRKRMGFGGFIISDWNAHGQVAGCTNASCPQAINAGLDMYMAPDSWKPLWNSLVAQVKDGTVSTTRLDNAVSNILRVKIRAGLFEAGRPSQRALSGRFDLLGSAEHRALAREAVRKSLVLLKNERALLPLARNKKILVVGDGADDIGRQSGGWTLTWQGTGVTNARFPKATSIWKGISDAVSAGGGTATLSVDGGYREKPDAAIVVFGETPYAEFQGDIKSLRLKGDDRALGAMRRLRADGIPVVAVFISGRPLWMNRELNASNAFVAAWLPGSEGGGIADMLFRKTDGDPAYEFQGRLGYTWPRTAAADGTSLFPLGYGLKTTDSGTLVALSEDPGVSADQAATGLYFDNGLPIASWSLQVTDGKADTTRITTTPVTAAGGRVRVTAVNHLTQEGARRFVWSGDGAATVELVTHAPVDVTRETNGDVMLLITMRIDGMPTKDVMLGARCGNDCGGTASLRFADTIKPGQWRTAGIPLKCFARGGADMARLDAPFRLTTAGRMDLSISRVALGTVADDVLPCGTAAPAP
ncbi:glycoside hydrolase family 3 protein [Sphingomonas cavernae]|uniref:glycoside hydrolase family 3 protein n=1 Tax=Sphingomonas cavernae TaxID=2320861 RepID=UPI001C71FB4E|nr:exo 1,3/1,4-beta-D-glucan glucohydrolase [Sphingomonas cavernae]